MQAIPTSPEQASASVGQLFSYPFRIFFLSMTILALAAIPLWVMQVNGVISLPLAMPGLFWHQHEMLFGFLSAAIAGFLLTAVCVWTQTERTHGFRLVLLWGVWLAGRLLLATGAELPYWLVQGVNLAFLPLVMVDAGWRIWHARQKRQLMIMVVLGLLWLMQIGFVTRLDMAFSYGALIMAMALISIIGGRITPAFSTGWLRQRGLDSNAVKTIPALDMATVFSLILLMASLVTGWQSITGALAVLSGALMLVRLAGWKGWLVREEPLLWILHLSILWVPVSLFLLAGTLFAGWPSNAWSHAAGTGAVACLILGVIARVALGHSGRPLVLPKGMVLAFVAIHLAALIRVLTAFEIIPWHPGIGSSTLLWLFAFGMFLYRYTGILASPRPDGREG
ncbi:MULTISPECIES: NnrS family protein [Marinobacter]|uniref:NnrS family protein n=1 Tax=Marinobacter TaxID=2742 RepID=UPI001926D428|nr:MULTISPECIES: NnrS family protein [Marinobacter]MBL3827058.1 NnrS family protein [Marinobacter sp. MC3]MBL3895564.1 NnrS family protein [Marinobacter sp. MW3]MCD1649145.1 NnrS family protein [Marinobacter adhaerens]